MSGLLSMTDEFIERMMNPSFGALTNSDYSMKLGDLLADSASSELLVAEARRLSRVDELSSHTWLWLTTQPQIQTVLNPDLLLDLCLQFESATFRAIVIDCALRGGGQLEPTDARAPDSLTVEDIENRWLLALVRSVVQLADVDQNADSVGRDVGPGAYRSSHSLLVALLTVNRPDCRQAASALLHHDWAGQEALLAFFDSRMATMDGIARSPWERLRPDRPRPN